jgi:hypothetical protein
MANPKPTGNRTTRRGSRYIQRFAVDRSTAQTYKLLIVQRGWPYTPESVAKIAAELAEAAWQEIDRPYQEDAEREGMIL